MKPKPPTFPWPTDTSDWVKRPVSRPKRQTKDQRIAELEDIVRRQQERLDQLETDRILAGPKTGRPRDLIARRS